VNTQTSTNIIFTKLSTLRQGKSLEYVLVYPVDMAVESCKKTPEFLKKRPLSRAGKHPDFQVTLCIHFVTTNVDFACIESEYCPIINANIVDQA
jgi:hypothetical protein